MKRLYGLIAALYFALPAAAQHCIPSAVTDQYTYFVAVDSVDKVSRETGLSSFTVVRSRNGAADATFNTPTVAEIDSSTMPGVYALLLDEDMTLDSGDDIQHMALHITHDGMEPVTKEICVARSKVTAGETFAVSSGVGSVNVAQISGDSTAADNFEAFLDLIVGQSGAFAPLGIKASGTAQAYTSGTPSVTLADAEAFGDDTLVGNLIWVRGSSGATYWQEAFIVSNVGSTDVATIDEAFAVSPSGTLTYIIWGTADIQASAGDAPTAEEVADEVETRFPANFDTLAITMGGAVTVGTNNDKTGYRLSATGVDDIFEEALSGHTTGGTAGERLGRIPNAAAGQNGGLPTVDGNNRVAGIQGTINTLDALDTAQDSQHSATISAIGALNNLADTDLRDLVIEDQGGGVSLGCALAVLLAYAAGDIATSEGDTDYKDPSGTEERITGTVSSPGNRAASITCPTY